MNSNRTLLRKSGRASGFTMVEIILVVVIIMTLAAVVGPRLVGRANQARVNTTKIQMSAIKTALGNYEVQVGLFPTTAQGLDAMINRPSDVTEEEWGTDKYMDSIPKDAWGTEFKYTCPSEKEGKDYDLTSAGRDKKFDTKDDIANDPVKKESKL